MAFKRMSVAYFSLGLVMLAGCSSKSGAGNGPPPQVATLGELTQLLHASTTPSGRAPTKLADLARNQSMFPASYEAVKSGDIVVLWGGAMKDEGDSAGGGGDVIAYEKDTPTNGGYVLLTSGEVKQMSPAEFNSAPKAGKK